jgi:hypothetical protein
MDDHPHKDHPQLVNVKRINSTYKRSPSNNSTTSLQDDQIIATSPPITTRDKSGSQTSLQTPSSTRSSISNIFKVSHLFASSDYCLTKSLLFIVI